jgi:hypothetical protein
MELSVSTVGGVLIALVQSHPSGVIGIVTPGGGLMKSEALKKVRNPGIRTYSK